MLSIVPNYVAGPRAGRHRAARARTRVHAAVILAVSLALGAGAAPGAPVPKPVKALIDNNCSDCHDADTLKADLDLTALAFEPGDPANLALWVKVHDRVAAGEMPPKKHEQPGKKAVAEFVGALDGVLTKAEHDRVAREGRATQRRLNRYEYENALRDLLQAPWLQVRDALPEDGEAYRFNKIGDALDVSHVQMARYLNVADYALRQTLATQATRPETRTVRYYAREQASFTGPMKFTVFNTSPERATFPLLGRVAQPDVRRAQAPVTVGAADPAKRDEEAVGVVASSYEPIEPKFNKFRAPVAGHYKIRLNAFSVWAGPTKDPKHPAEPDPRKWFIPDLDDISPGRRNEPMTVYSEVPPRQLRWLGKFDVTPEPAAHELDVWLLAGETIRPDATRLFRSRPGAARFQNPLAEKDGQPGVAFRWLEVEGPIYDEWPTAGHRLLFGDLPLRKTAKGASTPVEVISSDPAKDAARLMANFVQRAYRRPVGNAEAKRFLPVVETALKTGSDFTDAMIAGYTAVLCSPEFLCLEEKPGRLDDFAIASRLSFFLWNSPPDDELRAVAAKGALHQPAVLRAQTDRLLNDPKARRFVDAFLDYWLDLRKITATAPDSALYGDYYLDDALAESAKEESQLYFAELVRGDLPAREVVASDFAMVNERLAAHYGLPPVAGVALRKVALPADSVRGGFMTQAAVLKVTANGTTTSPVVRGAWIMERILGQPPPPPPPSVPAIEPDTRGAVTIRQQLERHRTQETCAACHANIDPAGFALESFDVMGGWRDRYRAEGGKADPGIAKSGQKFLFHAGLPVDCSGVLPDGRAFSDIRGLKQLLLANETQIARNLARQLVVFATGAPVRYGDRAAVELMLKHTQQHGYGVRSLIHEVVQSDLFLNK
jgi:hypothetical protein